MTPTDEEKPSDSFKFIPTVKYFVTTYAIGFSNNDRKAVRTFKMYEPQEKVRRLQGELMALKKSRVPEPVRNNVIGKNRSSKYGSHERWAELMLIWISQKDQ